MADLELVVVVGRGGPKESDWEPIQEMVIRPCPPNANTQTPLEIRTYRRQVDTGEIVRTRLAFWADDG